MEFSFLVAVTLSAAATIALRTLPVVFLSRIQLPSTLSEWLALIPTAIMAAIIMVEILAKPTITESGWSISALSALCSLAIGLLTRSLFLIVLSGVTAFMALQWLLP
jgi:branched-subunit amino acid transport protein